MRSGSRTVAGGGARTYANRAPVPADGARPPNGSSGGAQSARLGGPVRVRLRADPVEGEGEQPVGVGRAAGVPLGGQRNSADERKQVVDGHPGAHGAGLSGPAQQPAARVGDHRVTGDLPVRAVPVRVALPRPVEQQGGKAAGGRDVRAELPKPDEEPGPGLLVPGESARPGAQHLDAPAEHRLEQRPARGEVPVQRGGAYPGPPRDPLQRGVGPVPGDGGPGRGEYPVAVAPGVRAHRTPGPDWRVAALLCHLTSYGLTNGLSPHIVA